MLHVNSILTWDQEWYSGVVFGIVTAFYLAVWYWDPTLVTFVAFSGLFLTLADYVGPKIINQVCVDQIKEIFKSMDFDVVSPDFRFTARINGHQ